MAIAASKRSKHTPRTPSYLAFESLGFALGRLYESSPQIAEAMQAGLARAILARAVLRDGKDLKAISRELLEASERVRDAHGITPTEARSEPLPILPDARAPRRPASPSRRAKPARSRASQGKKARGRPNRAERRADGAS